MITDGQLFVLAIIISAMVFRLVRMGLVHMGIGPRIVGIRSALTMLIISSFGFVLYGFILRMVLGLEDGYGPAECVILLLVIYFVTNTVIGMCRDVIIHSRHSDET